MKIPPQSCWDRDPIGTYRRIMQELNRDRNNGYLTDSEYNRLRTAADTCYMKGKLNHAH